MSSSPTASQSWPTPCCWKVGNRYCSKVCCATAVKQACEIKQQFPDAVVYCFYMDLRMFGRGYEDMYLEAQKKYGVIFVRGRVSEVSEDKDGHLFVISSSRPRTPSPASRSGSLSTCWC